MDKRDKLVILGGTGSLGKKLIDRYRKNYSIINFSRDECKHHLLKSIWKNEIENYSCDIYNYDKLIRGLLQYDPKIIIMAAAMKHIDACEKDSEASIQTNIIGIKNVLDAVERNLHLLNNIKCVVMVSTDKACSPVNTYGICKALAEKMTIERALRCPKIKWVVTRYGNILNSRGSIIPFLHNLGKMENVSLTLTDKRMTRYIMTLDQSVSLIDYAINSSPSGTITVSILPAMKIVDLFEIFSVKYKKDIKIIGSKKGEKINEDLINNVEAELARYANNSDDIKYVILYPNIDLFNQSSFKIYDGGHYHSGDSLISKDELTIILEKNLFI